MVYLGLDHVLQLLLSADQCSLVIYAEVVGIEEGRVEGRHEEGAVGGENVVVNVASGESGRSGAGRSSSTL